MTKQNLGKVSQKKRNRKKGENSYQTKLKKAKNGVWERMENQCKDGKYNLDEYNHGIANGLILAVSIICKTKPEYIKVDKFKKYKGISRILHRLLRWTLK